MAQFTLSNLAFLKESQGAYNQPVSQALIQQLIYNYEVLFMLLAGQGTTGTLTSDPPNDTTGYLTDSASSWTDDEHNGRTVVVTDGNGALHFYTIDDTQDTNNRLVCTGDNLYADGIRSGDAYRIFYDLQNTDGHDHDGSNSAYITTLASGVVARAQLETDTGEASGSVSAGSYDDVELQEYTFFPRIYQSTGNDVRVSCQSVDGSGTTAEFALWNTNGSTSRSYEVAYRYVTATDKPFSFLLRDAEGVVTHAWLSGDPPPRYWGLRETPPDFRWPIRPADPRGLIAQCGWDLAEKYHRIFREIAVKDRKPLIDVINEYELKPEQRLFTRKNLAQI